MSNEISPWLLEKISKGQAVLFLGAGAAIGAKGENGETLPNANQLRDELCKKFLGGDEMEKPLIKVADYAKHVAGLPEVQTFIREKFYNLQPADFHQLIADFKWHAIFTTNYDLILERAYQKNEKRQQDLRSIIRDGDRFSEVIQNQNTVPYFKLHGCINTVNDRELPLILASVP